MPTKRKKPVPKGAKTKKKKVTKKPSATSSVLYEKSTSKKGVISGVLILKGRIKFSNLDNPRVQSSQFGDSPPKYDVLLKIPKGNDQHKKILAAFKEAGCKMSPALLKEKIAKKIVDCDENEYYSANHEDLAGHVVVQATNIDKPDLGQITVNKKTKKKKFEKSATKGLIGYNDSVAIGVTICYLPQNQTIVLYLNNVYLLEKNTETMNAVNIRRGQTLFEKEFEVSADVEAKLEAEDEDEDEDLEDDDDGGDATDELEDDDDDGGGFDDEDSVEDDGDDEGIDGDEETDEDDDEEEDDEGDDDGLDFPEDDDDDEDEDDDDDDF